MARVPDQNIGPDYLHRWWLIPRNKYFNIYLHKVLQSDRDEGLHDHPWHSLSFLLKGTLGEVYYDKDMKKCPRMIRRWVPVFRPATFSHRLLLTDSGPAWTLFITGPTIRRWGFWHSSGKIWTYWKTFLGVSD